METEGNFQNANPIVYEIGPAVQKKETYEYDDENELEEMTPEEIFEHIRCINDPEHPLTLEQLKVVTIDQVKVDEKARSVDVLFTPTVPHCSMATLIGLCIRVKLLRSLSKKYKVTVNIYPGSHNSEDAVNKQLNDKERVAAALENGHLLDVVNNCIVQH